MENTRQRKNSNKAVQSVYIENNPSRFKLLTGNRSIKSSEVSQIVRSMKKYGFVGSPIVVNEHHQIIEGQHRVEAAIIAGVPVKYIVDDRHMTLEAIQDLNACQSKWSDIDHVKSKADMGDNNCYNYYMLYNEFVKDRKLVTNSTILAVVMRAYNSISMSCIKSGKFSLELTEYEEARKILEFIGECYNILKEKSITKLLGRNDYFGRAILFMVDCGADKERIIKVLKANAIEYQSTSTVELALTQLQKYYNKNLRGGSVILFTNLYEQSLYEKKVNKNREKVD